MFGFKKPAPLLDDLGPRLFPITTASEQAQQYFNQGVALLYAFNHAEAIRSFSAVTNLDARCPMAYWGLSYAYGPNINKPMDDTAVTNAWVALQQALRLKGNANAREQAYIDALATRYRAEPSTNRSELDAAYASAMRGVARRFPDDPHAATLCAESIMDTTPWNYWKDGKPKPEMEEALALLNAVMLRDPSHPGANHFFIHAIEAGPEPGRALPSADRLGKAAPGAGHLVHMPSHIYVRVGEYHQATEVNRQASEVDRAYISHCRAQGFYPGMYYPHNVHFTWFSAAIEGRSKLSMDSARQVAGYGSDPWCGTAEVPESIRFRHLVQLTNARFGRWDEVLKVPPITVLADQFLLDRVMWHYCRTLAFAARTNAAEAARESESLADIAASPKAKTLDTPFFPASGVMTVALHVAAAKAAGAQGNKLEMIQQLEKAVAAQDALPYMEPPYWYYPTRLTLAAACLGNGDATRGEEIFRQTLRDFPRHPWSLFGLEQCLRKQGRTDAAESVHREFLEAWKHADTPLDLSMF